MLEPECPGGLMKELSLAHEHDGHLQGRPCQVILYHRHDRHMQGI